MKKQDIGLAYEISTIDLKEPNFLKALGIATVAMWTIWFVYQLLSIWSGLNELAII